MKGSTISSYRVTNQQIGEDKMKRIVTAVIIVLMATTMALAHGGRTDQYGGHYDNRTGGYHYHR